MKESIIQTHITSHLRYLENCGVLLFERTNNFKGAVLRRSKKGTTTGYLKTGKTGSTDIKVYLPYGKTLHLEIKNEKGRQSPEQIEWQGKLERLKHIYRVVRSTDQLKSILVEICPEVFKHLYQIQ